MECKSMYDKTEILDFYKGCFLAVPN